MVPFTIITVTVTFSITVTSVTVTFVVRDIVTISRVLFRFS